MTDVQLAEEMKIDAIQMRKAAHVLRAINHSLRQQMMRLLHQKQTMTVTELYIALRLEQSVASQHLAILRQARVVIAERKAKNIFYSVNYQRLDELHAIAAQLLR